MNRQSAEMDEQWVLGLIERDRWLMEILKTANSLHLPDWWLCAGVIRTKIWDVLHGFENPTAVDDIDVIYFDPSDLNEQSEKRFEKQLLILMPDVPWSVKNQARMHMVNEVPPYLTGADAISKFPETATALGVKLGSQGRLLLAAPFGLRDVLEMKLKPTPAFRCNGRLMKIYHRRLEQKRWMAKWPQIEVHESGEGDCS